MSGPIGDAQEKVKDLGKNVSGMSEEKDDTMNSETIDPDPSKGRSDAGNTAAGAAKSAGEKAEKK